MSENIYTAINEIMNEVGYIKKKRASGLNYTYAGEAALIQAIRPEMVEHQVIMFVQNFELLSEEPYTTSNKKIMHDVKVKAEIVFHHAPSDTKIIVSALGEGADTSDKATNKAMTGAYKYALRQTFCIETGDDPDRERADRAPKQQEQKQQEQKPAQEKQSGIVANDRYNKIVLLRTQITEKAQVLGVYNATDNQRQLLRHLLDDVIFQDKGDKRHQLLYWLFSNQSLKAEGGISGGQIKIMLDWLSPVKDSGGAYAVGSGQTKACFEIARQEEKDKGQIELEL